MNIKFYFFIIFFSTFCYSQNFSKVDALVELYPKHFSKIDELVDKINLDFITPEDKARATFCWICKNIGYDVEFSKKIDSQNIQAFSYKTNTEFIQKEKKFNFDLAQKTFKTKMAVCYGYAALFNEIANRLGVESKLIRGNLKCDPNQIGKKLEINHGWNVVKINNQWQLIDCTLGAGNIASKTQQFVYDYNDIYFFTKPELFFLNHFPEDEKWLLSQNKSKSEYIKFPIFFVDFLKNKDKIMLPNSGIISQKATFDVKFDAFNFDEDYIEYSFSGDNKRNYAEFDSNAINFNISLENKANQLLFIFLNRKPVAIYSIIN